jgi:single-strand DNA-binding protein
MQVDEVGPSLRYATAKVNRSQRGSTGGFGAEGGAGGGGAGGGGNFAPADDPWASSGPAAGGSAAGFSDEPPF